MLTSQDHMDSLSALNSGSKGVIYMPKVCFREQSMPIVKFFRLDY